MKLKKILVFSPVFLLLVYFFLILLLFPFYSEFKGKTLEAEGVSGKVFIAEDENGILHVKAENLLDLFFAQGFIHCWKRFFQMDLNRRLASARMAELFGKSVLNIDRTSARYALPLAAEKSYRHLFPEELEILKAYTKGVNYCLQVTRPSFEYKLLLSSRRKWNPEDSIHVVNVLAWSLGSNFYEELTRLIFLNKMPELFDKGIWPLLDPPFSDVSPFISGIIGFSIDLHGELNAFIKSFYPGGSNNWVVSPAKSATGAAILANDPHLGVTIPGIWLLMHLQAPNYNVIGVSLPGLPGIVIGRNEDIAWGFTNSFADCQDLLRTEIKGDKYLFFGGKWKKLQKQRFIIKVIGGKDIVEEIKLTELGPIVFKNFILAWTGYLPSHPIKAMFLLNTAKNWEEFRKAFIYWGVPSQNAVYADREGNIGYQLTGLVPKREGWSGLYPVKIDTVKGWKEFYPLDELPHLYNPEAGFIVTANNALDPEFPAVMDVYMGYRAKRLRDTLQAKEKLTIEDMKRMQLDFHSEYARRILPAILNILKSQDLKEPYLSHLEKLKSWDFNEAPSSQEAALFESLIMELQKKLFFPDKPELQKIYLGQPNDGPTSFSLFGIKSREAILRLIEKRNNYFINILSGGKYITVGELLEDAFTEAVKKAGGKTWGEIHRIKLKHILSLSKPIDLLFGPFINGGNFPYGGNYETPCQAGVDLEDRTGIRVLPSYRQIIDFSDPDKSLWIAYPGQNGYPSRNYKNLFSLWYSGKYLYMSMKIPERTHKLFLVPKK